MPIRTIHAALMLGLPLLLLAACSDDMSRSFGFAREAPDEFTVTTRAPLSMPPDYEVRPPRPGAPRPQEQSQTAQAEASLSPDAAYATGPAAAGGASRGQAALVTQAGQPAPADVRRRVDAEAPVAAADRGFVDRLMFWRGSETSTVVDPQKEAARLRANAALGKSPEDGTTPVAEPAKSGFFDRLF